MKKFTTIFKAVLPMLAFLGVQLIVSFGVGIAYVVFYAFKLGFLQGFEGETQEFSVTSQKIADALLTPEFTDISSLIVMVVSVIFFSFWYFLGKPQKSFAKLSEVFSIRNISIILVVGIAIQLACSSALSMILPLFPKIEEEYMHLMETLVGENTVIAVITTVICAPLTEEFVFRGLIFKQLRKDFTFLFANLFQALLFGIVHMNIVQGVYAFIMGLLFAYFFERTRSIWASVALHAAINGSGILLEYLLPESVFMDESGTILWIFLIVGVLIIIPLCFLLRKPADPIAEAESTVSDILESNTGEHRSEDLN